jgi:hypothetical protein
MRPNPTPRPRRRRAAPQYPPSRRRRSPSPSQSPSRRSGSLGRATTRRLGLRSRSSGASASRRAHRARSHRRVAPPLTRLAPDSLTSSVPFISDATMRPNPRAAAGPAAFRARRSGKSLRRRASPSTTRRRQRPRRRRQVRERSPGEVVLGLGRIVALHHRSPTVYGNSYHIRCLCF